MAWVTALAALYGAYDANQNAKKNRKALKPSEELLRLQADQAKLLAPRGQSYLDRADQAFNPVMNFYLRAANGGQDALGRLLKPEVSRINADYDRARTSMAETGPRTGVGAEVASSLPFQRLASIHNLYGTARMGSLNALSQLGGNFATIGGGLLGQGMSGAGNAVAGYQGNVRTLMDIQAERDRQMAAAGEGLYDSYRGWQAWRANRGK